MKVQINREEFLASGPIALTLEGQQVLGKPREFGTGSLGYNFTGKVTRIIGGVPCQLQVSANVAICGSKPE